MKSKQLLSFRYVFIFKRTGIQGLNALVFRFFYVVPSVKIKSLEWVFGRLVIFAECFAYL